MIIPLTTDSRGDVVLRVVPRMTDINSNGHIFGGWVLSQMDIAGGIIAGQIAQGPVATVAIEHEVHFPHLAGRHSVDLRP
ncbi:Thioesterase superfamily protein [Sphingobium faniae]|nr:Thioesterase superfamily protein [Sphingobium faniae]